MEPHADRLNDPAALDTVDYALAVGWKPLAKPLTTLTTIDTPVARYVVAVGWKPLDSGRPAVDFRHVASTATRRRSSHARRPGHRRTASARAESSDESSGEPPRPALRLARPPKALYNYACLTPEQRGAGS